jgi:predicted thioesterase
MSHIVGRWGEADLVVSAADLATAFGSGDVEVLATPRVLALAEVATVAAAAPGLADEETTVGVHVELDHLAPAPLGRSVVARAVLVAVNDRRLSFDVTVYDGETLLARGRVERVIVDRRRFASRARADRDVRPGDREPEPPD